MMWTITFRMLSLLASFAFVSISIVQSRSDGLNCLEQNYEGGKSCPGGICARVWPGLQRGTLKPSTSSY